MSRKKDQCETCTFNAEFGHTGKKKSAKRKSCIRVLRVLCIFNNYTRLLSLSVATSRIAYR